MEHDKDAHRNHAEPWTPRRGGIVLLTLGAAGGYFVVCGLLAAVAWAATCQESVDPRSAAYDTCAFLEGSDAALAGAVGVLLILAAGACAAYMRRLWPLVASALVAFAGFASLLMLA